MKIEYPISVDYVNHWGTWEATREVLQNALDAGVDINSIKYNEVNNILTICNKGSLNRSNLLLGITTKVEGNRGKYGEGLKLAMLVFARNKRFMNIFTGSEKWVPSIQFSHTYNADVLVTEINKSVTEYVIVKMQITNEEYTKFKENYVDSPYGKIDKPEGSIYVGGLFVCKMENIKYAYNFPPDLVTLNRDRDIPSMFDVQWAAQKYLSGEEIIDCAISNKSDVSAGYGCDIHKVARSWTRSYPNVVPVGMTEQNSVIVDKSHSIKIVPDWLAKAVRSVTNFVINFNKSPAERLRNWIDSNSIMLSPSAKGEIEEIYKSLIEVK